MGKKIAIEDSNGNVRIGEDISPGGIETAVGEAALALATCGISLLVPRPSGDEAKIRDEDGKETWGRRLS